MAHPYSKHAGDKAGREKAKSYQEGGSVENYKRGKELLSGKNATLPRHPVLMEGYVRQQMNEARRISDAVPRRKGD